MTLKNFIENKNLVINTMFISQVVKLKLSLNEFLILMYFDNLITKEFNVQIMIDFLKMTEKDALAAFNKLIEKKLLLIVTEKNDVGKIVEKVNLDGFYSLIVDDFKFETKKCKKDDIYSVFEKEFGRPISSMEYEIINAWLDKSFSEELILGALKEAVYNGVTNLRYIDKILYEWQKKGFKTMTEVEKYISNRTNKKEEQKVEELFDYNWLDENN